jgi:short-subunit dehydrogenase
MSKAALKSLDYALNISSNVIALHISTTPEHTEKLQKQWEEYNIGIPLVVINAPYRNILNPLESYISELESKLDENGTITVILTKFVGYHLYDSIFHNQTTYFIESKLGKHEKVITVLVPYIYNTSFSTKTPVGS